MNNMLETNNIPKPEFRLYYDSLGEIICYTCEKLEGNYIVIDQLTFAEARPDVKVVGGKLVKKTNEAYISKLVVSEVEGTLCEREDVSVITTNENGIRWKLETYHPYTGFLIKKIL